MTLYFTSRCCAITLLYNSSIWTERMEILNIFTRNTLSRYGLWVHRYLPTMAKMPNQEKQYNTKPCETP